MENTNTLNIQQTEQTELENNEKKEVQTEKRRSVIDVYGEDFFGKLLPYIADMNITDINCNGRDVWLNDVKNGRYKAPIDFSEKDVNKLAYRVSNTENVQFNKNYPTLQADLMDLRFEFTHNTFSVSGTTCSIRKTPIVARISDASMKGEKVNYLSELANRFLTLAVKQRLNTIICGLTGSGKTELTKHLMGKTEPSERIITIEDTSELHLAEIYKDKDIVELKVNEFVDYDGAIKACMRMLPVWILLSEARGKEVKELLKSISTGAKIISTLHTDNAKQIPSRMLNMFEDNELSNEKVENMIYEYLDLGIHIRVINSKPIVRYVDQIVYFEIDEHGNKTAHELYKVKQNNEGTYYYVYNKFPKQLMEKLGFAGFQLEREWEEKAKESKKYKSYLNNLSNNEKKKDKKEIKESGELNVTI